MTGARVEVVFGTRPEAVKCAPLVRELRGRRSLWTTVTITGQHRGLADEVNSYFGIRPDADLDVFRQGSSLAETGSTLFARLCERWERDAPGVVVVQGDTASAALAAVAAHYAGAHVVHLEAGLRSGDLWSPFPEEGNRRLISSLASLHLAPTEGSARNLHGEGIAPDRVVVTGNTGIDALLYQIAHPVPFTDPRLESIVTSRSRMVLVTMHRRESWGGGLSRVVRAVADTIAETPDSHAVIPLHPNPRVRAEVVAAVGGCERVTLCEPLPYAEFGRLLASAYVAVTDSGGVQEEAPAVGVPVLVARDTTERTEGIDAGNARLVGTQSEHVRAELVRVLSRPELHESMARSRDVYGDGRAAQRCADAIDRLVRSPRTRTAAGIPPAAQAAGIPPAATTAGTPPAVTVTDPNPSLR